MGMFTTVVLNDDVDVQFKTHGPDYCETYSIGEAVRFAEPDGRYDGLGSDEQMYEVVVLEGHVDSCKPTGPIRGVT